jgi:hypothetical protein
MADFSTKQFAWKDITIVFGGRVIDGITNVEYSKKKNKEALFGRGNKPWVIQHGNFEYEGKIELWQSEINALELSAPDGEILNMEFDMTVAYVPEGLGYTVIKTLKGCQFTDQTEGMQQGDTHMKVELPIMFLDIKKHL